MDIANKLQKKLQQRLDSNSLRTLAKPIQHTDVRLIDFASNDYLGFAQSESIFHKSHDYLIKNNINRNGATGSRLISGNHTLYDTLEKMLCSVHLAKSCLVFNSGYDANLGLLSSIPQRTDIIFYDKLCHASIRDGMQLSHAKSYAFAHNDLSDLKSKLQSVKTNNNNVIYVITESVFSMDGDSPDLIELTKLCKSYQAKLIVDEAHALGVHGLGLVQELELQEEVFARVMTFGKALGCHGAVILGSQSLINYLINFSRPFIYTTGLNPHSLSTILIAYEELINLVSSSLNKNTLQTNIDYFKALTIKLNMSKSFIQSNSAIQSCIIPDNNRVKYTAQLLQKEGFDIKAILAPTVENGQQCLRFCLHSFNTEQEIKKILILLNQILHKNE
jgi:8-amino-7-oxononanoate synthase